MPASTRSGRSPRSRSSARLAADAVVRALNARLPPPCACCPRKKRRPTFHARFDARSKTYRYRIWNGDVVSPFERRLRVARAAARSTSTRCAAAARTARRPPRLRGVSSRGQRRRARPSARSSSSRMIAIRRSDRSRNARARITYEVCGDGFLRHMVRTIVGIAGRGRARPPAGRRGWPTCSRRAIARQAGPTAPAAGLFLVSVEYRLACG